MSVWQDQKRVMEQIERDLEVMWLHIGQEVRRHRKAAGLRQEDLASRVNMTRVSVTNLEAGRQRTGLSTLWCIAGVLGVPLRELIPEGP